MIEVSGRMTTKFGDVQVNVFDETRLGLITYGKKPITVRGVQYRVNVGMSLIDGQWKPKSYQDVYIDRVESRTGRYDTTPSEAARRAIQDELIRALNSWDKRSAALVLKRAAAIKAYESGENKIERAAKLRAEAETLETEGKGELLQAKALNDGKKTKPESMTFTI